MKQILRHRYSSALLLVMIYGLQLGLFNLMMEASFPVQGKFARSFVRVLENSKNHHHPSLVSYCQRLLKHEDGKKYNYIYRSGYVAHLLNLFSISADQPGDHKIVYSDSPQDFHLPDDAYRRYSLIRVFLI